MPQRRSALAPTITPDEGMNSDEELKQQDRKPAKKQRRTQEKDIPLFERLAADSAALKASQVDSNAFGDSDGFRKANRKQKRSRGGAETDSDAEEVHEKPKVRSKNAPAEMPSNKPVRRLYVNANNSVHKTRDPRFSNVSGELNQRIFNKTYSFLDDYRESEIKKLAEVEKKVKNSSKKEDIHKELIKMKQEATERRRALNTQQRLDAMRQEERRKVKEGIKQPYFMKSSAVKEVALEERYKDLKATGKLQKFMAKKRKHNSSKDRKMLPTSRRNEE